MELKQGICEDCFDLSDNLFMGLCPDCLRKHMGLPAKPARKRRKKRFDDEPTPPRRDKR